MFVNRNKSNEICSKPYVIYIYIYENGILHLITSNLHINKILNPPMNCVNGILVLAARDNKLHHL
jgi:hypothetical protein